MAIIPRPFTDDDRRAWGLFEALVEDNASIGRPEKVIMDFSYKHSRVKQYLKEGRASRIETVVNKCSALGLQSRIEHPLELVAKARRVHDRLLAIDHN